ncbi:MAG: hypothetical protein JSW61_05935 [Candidatus Thorarchaeota archaeon]|nr:MAG: hypothetical protein JSW61_05935 [Candidatus Thorarchaeota archaeon]
MKRSLPELLSLLMITGLLWSFILVPVQSLPPTGWSGDDNFHFLVEVNNVSAYHSNLSSPIPVDLSTALAIELSINVIENLTLHSGLFTMSYLSIPIINQPFDINTFLPSGFSADLLNESLDIGTILGVGGLSLFSGTVTGVFSFTYSLLTDPDTNVTVTEDFVLQVGPTGPAAIMSVTGLITLGFTVMSVFGLLMAMDDFQQGILAARKMRGAKRGSDVGIFPRAVVLRRRPRRKKDQESVDKEELKRRVSEAAGKAWDGKRCPKCGKKWKVDAPNCSKCKIESSAAVAYFSQDIADYAPKAMKVMRPKSKMPVGKFSKKLKLKPNKGGALAAAMTDMGIFQTKSVKVPLMKVAFAGMTLSGTYWSWMQILSGAIPSWIDLLITATIGLVVSVAIAYFMNWLARVPPLGYD